MAACMLVYGNQSPIAKRTGTSKQWNSYLIQAPVCNLIIKPACMHAWGFSLLYLPRTDVQTQPGVIIDVVRAVRFSLIVKWKVQFSFSWPTKRVTKIVVNRVDFGE